MLKNDKGFTLVEMLIVMLIITVLMLLIIPNIIDQTDNVNEKGCEALVSVVQAQADAYYLEEGEFATIDALAAADYIEDTQTSCNNIELSIGNYGKVQMSE
jgi:competence protein ComGC